MAELSKIFKSNELYEAWRNEKQIPSNVLAVVLNEDGDGVDKVAFGTNDITGSYETYEVEKGTTPTGTINITENGEVDVTEYATANVNIPIPSLPPILSITVTDSNNKTTVSPVFDGMGNGMPIAQDIVAGGNYTFTVVAVGDVASRLTNLTIDAYIDWDGEPVNRQNFVGATVKSFTKDGVTYSSISKTITTYSGNCESFAIDFGDVRYTRWIAS